jgi:hypothetical protein
MNAPGAERRAVEPGAPAEYHIVKHGPCWDIERNAAFVGVSAQTVQAATEEAIRLAIHDHHCGMDATVCVEEHAGCRHLWP